jgi:excisionase family DNA binding protein
MGKAEAFGPVVVISGASAYQLAQLLRAQPVQMFIRSAGWLCTPAMVEVQRAVHEAAGAWDDQRERTDALRCSPTPPARVRLISVEQASNLLALGVRRIQALAATAGIEGWKIGGRWQLDAASVAAYHEQRRERSLCPTLR